MTFDTERLLEDLRSEDPDILTLALGTLARLNLKNSHKGHEFVRGLHTRVLPLLRHENKDIAFLARKARNHIENQFPQIFQESNPERDLPGVKELMHENEENRLPAILAWIEQKPESLMNVLMRQLIVERSPKVLAPIALALAELNEKDAVPLLEVFLHSPHDRLRANAAEAIGRLGSREQILTLLPPLLGDSINRVRANAIEAVGKHDPREIVEQLKSMIKSPSIPDRASALHALTHLKGEDILKLLSLASNDPWEGNRLKLVKILQNRKEAETIPVLRRLAQDVDIEVSEAAMNALKDLSEGEGQKLVELNRLQNPEEEPEIPAQEGQPQGPSKESDLMDLDEQMDNECLFLGQSILQAIHSGTMKGELFHKQLFVLDKHRDQLEKHQIRMEDKSLLRSMGRIVGAGVDLELAIRELESKIEDTTIEIGYLAVELHQKEETIFPGMMERIKRILKLFGRRHQIKHGDSTEED